MERKKRVSFFSSLSTKIAIIMLISTTVAMSLTEYSCLVKMERLNYSVMNNYACTIAEDSARSIDAAENGGVLMTSEIVGSMVAGAKIKDSDSSCIYVCQPDGSIIYHPTASKIGTAVTNSSVKEILAKANSKGNDASGSFAYEEDGVSKIAGYAFTNSKMLVVLSADYDDVMSAVDTTTQRVNKLNLANMIVLAIMAFIVSKLFLRTIPKIVDVVEDTTNYDFRHKPGNEALLKRRDELGYIARALLGMRNSLRDIVNQIEDSTDVLTQNIENLKDNSIDVNSICMDNSATTEELAAGTEETCATTDTINDDIDHMISNAKEIDSLAIEGGSLSDDISRRAQDLKVSMVEATQKTEEIYISVREKADRAIENAKVVSNINEMTNQIKEISSQTSLLALNASIEAARAGENGRGFAVVATEIGNLAKQTTNTVADIDTMVEEVMAAVVQMQECLTETTDFIGENVIADYKDFEKVSDQYDEDAGKFRDSMQSIRSGISELNGSIATVADSVSAINTTINEAAQGVTGIAKTTSEIVIKTNETVSRADECKQEILNLDDIVAKFALE